MQKFKPNIVPSSSETSSLLLNHIKDQQFYSTLSTITLQLAKEAGAQNELIESLSACLSKVKGGSNQSILNLEKQNNHNDQNVNKNPSGYYDPSQKNISFREQINFLSKMENQLVRCRQKQSYKSSLSKYSSQKQIELIPLLNIEVPTKTSRFKGLLNRKTKSKVCTTKNYFKLDPLDLLKNAYQNSNQCYTMLRNFTLLKTVFGHSMDEDRQSNCPLYNVLFDQSENFIISGGQEGAIKVWSKQTGLLLSSLKGHQEYINKLEVTKCNKYICSSAGDGIRFFLLKDMTTLGGWKSESIIDISSIYDSVTETSKFLFGDKRNLYVLDQLKMLSAKQRSLTKQDFLIFRYSHRISKESHILNIQISNDKSFVLIGFQSGDIVLFHYNDLFTIDPIKSQTDPLSNYFNLPIRHVLKTHRDQIRELKWHQNNQYFVSGGKQGFCILWEYKNQREPTLIKQIQVSKLFNRRKKRAFGCNFICFNSTNSHFVAGFMELVDDDDQDRGNGDVIAYSLEEKQVIFQFSKDMPIKVASVRGMDTHPIYPNIVAICEGTGRIIILDFLLKTILNTFELRGFHLLHPHFALNPGDCRFSKDGKYFVVSTQFGSISIFGYDLKSFYDTCPTQQFFSNDFTSFTLNEKLQPIPIEGDLQIDMNRVQRGQIRNIRGQIYQNQLTNNFQKFQNQSEKLSKIKAIDHKNTILFREEPTQQGQNYKDYLEKIKYNLTQAENFSSFYNKNLQQIQGSKQSLLYDQRQKQSKILRKIIEEKIKKMRGDTTSSLPLLTHDLILQQIDAKGKRGGRKLTKIGLRQNYPNYKDQNFDYDSAKEESYNIEQQNGEDQELKEIEYDVSNQSDSIPINTRRNFRSRLSTNRIRDPQTRYNIRSRPNQHYNYNEQEEVEEKPQRTFKRRSPAEDIQDMLKDQEFKNYDMTRGRKKRKRNQMDESDQDFIREKQSADESEYAGQRSSSMRMSRRQNSHRMSTGRRGRPKKHHIPEAQSREEQSQPHLNRLRKRQNDIEEEDYQKQYRIQEPNNPHQLRTRNQNSNGKHSSSKKKKQQDLGECYRCAVNPAVVICTDCQCACCQNCKSKRGKDVESNSFRCFICMYINSTGSAILQEKKLNEQYYRFDQRSQQIYVPQIDDEVRFFFQGYQEFLSHNVKNLNTEVTKQIEEYLLMPHIYNDFYEQTLLQTPLCKVKDIKFFFPFNNSDALSNMYKRSSKTEQKTIHMLINLELVLNEQKKQPKLEKTDFWVFFIPGPYTIQSDNQYLLREEIYQYIEENKVLQKLQENQTIMIFGDQYQIIKIGAAQDCFPQSIWKQIKVSRSDGKRLRHMSKQSEKRCNVWNLDQMVPKIPYEHNYKPEQYQKKILDRIKSARQMESEHVLFEDYIDFQIYPTYRKIVQVGINLSSIERRVKNNFYRSLNSFQFDLEHMVKNSISFNGEDNHVTRIGNRLRKQILKALNLTEDQIKKLNIDQRQQTNIKKQKRNIKKKQLDQGFVSSEHSLSNVHGLRPQRNTRTRNFALQQKPQQNRRDKRKISEQSEQNEYQVYPNANSDQESDEKFEQEQGYTNKKRPTRHSRNEKQKTLNNSKVDTTSKSKKYDKLIEDYDKEQQVYRNLQNHNRRSKMRYIDSSYESHEKNSGTGGYSTRRSTRLNH